MDQSAIRTLLPVSEFRTLHPDPNINYQLNRFLVPGLQKLFTEIGGRIKDFEDWKSEFLGVASACERNGNLAHAAGLYRTAEFFMSPDDPDRRRAFEKFIELFYRAHEAQPIERIQVPFTTGKLHGFRLSAAGTLRGTIVIHTGYDAYAEEFYALTKAIASCGYDVVIFDGPGQGTTLMRDKIPMIAEWERPVAAVLDYLGLIDVTLIGISLGGYLALRAAAFEPRIKRVIAYDVMLDFYQCITSRRGKIAELIINTLVALKLGWLLDAIARLLMKIDLYSRWGIQQGMHVMGCRTPSEFFFKLKAYNTWAISKRISQDTLIMAGAEDHFVPLQQFFDQLSLLINARSVTGQIFTRKDNAQSHCQFGNVGLAVIQMVSWIDAHSNEAKSVAGVSRACAGNG
jgi:pimeloyl-ACP methyl ester carboxylesterase